MRHKEHIVTHIYAPGRASRDLSAVKSHAEIWSNAIYVTCDKSGPDFSLKHTDEVSETRAEAHTWLYRNLTGVASRPQRSQHSWEDEDEPFSYYVMTCVALEPDWLINDPHIVRDAIELNSGATLFADRYMMISEDEYRTDGIYAPIPVAIAYQVRSTGRFSSELNSAPDYAWTSSLRAKAPFDILDFQLKGTDTSGATLRPYEDMIPILKEHT